MFRTIQTLTFLVLAAVSINAHADESTPNDTVYQCTYYGNTSQGLQQYTGASTTCGEACDYARRDCESEATGCRYSYCGVVK